MENWKTRALNPGSFFAGGADAAEVHWSPASPVRHPIAGLEFPGVALGQFHRLKRHPIADLEFPSVVQDQFTSRKRHLLADFELPGVSLGQLTSRKRHPISDSRAKRVAGELLSRPSTAPPSAAGPFSLQSRACEPFFSRLRGCN